MEPKAKERSVKIEVSETMSQRVVYANRYLTERDGDMIIIYFGFESPSRVLTDSVAVAVSVTDVRTAKENWAQYLNRSTTMLTEAAPPVWRPSQVGDVIGANMLMLATTNHLADTTATTISIHDVARAINEKKPVAHDVKTQSLITIRSSQSMQHRLIIELLDLCN